MCKSLLFYICKWQPWFFVFCFLFALKGFKVVSTHSNGCLSHIFPGSIGKSWTHWWSLVSSSSSTSSTLGCLEAGGSGGDGGSCLGGSNSDCAGVSPSMPSSELWQLSSFCSVLTGTSESSSSPSLGDSDKGLGWEAFAALCDASQQCFLWVWWEQSPCKVGIPDLKQNPQVYWPITDCSDTIGECV